MYRFNDYVKFNNKVWRVDAIQDDDIYLFDTKDSSFLVTKEDTLEPASNLDIVLHMLGIEKDVPFDVYNSDGTLCKSPYAPFTYNGDSIIDYDGGTIGTLLSNMLLHNLTAKPVNLVGKTFSPSRDDNYYYVSSSGGTSINEYTGCSVDLAFKLMGNMFETEEIAIANIESIMVKYKEVM